MGELIRGDSDALSGECIGTNRSPSLPVPQLNYLSIVGAKNSVSTKLPSALETLQYLRPLGALLKEGSGSFTQTGKSPWIDRRTIYLFANERHGAPAKAT